MDTNGGDPQATESPAPIILELRRRLFGFRRKDALGALEKQREQVVALTETVDRLRRENEAVEAKLAAERAHAEAQVAELAARAAERESEARANAARILADAQEQSARLRQEASVRVGDAAGRLEEVLRVREQLLGELRGILSAYGELLAQAEHGRVPAVGRVPADEPATVPEVPARLAEAARDAGLSPRIVQIDAGSFGDLAEVSAFERALARLPKVSDVHVRAFTGDRAEIELRLTEETALAHDLARHLPYQLSIVPDENGRMTIDVAPEAAEG